jgi:SET domain-containing protein
MIVRKFLLAIKYMSLNKFELIDAARKGSVTRFISHSCESFVKLESG